MNAGAVLFHGFKKHLNYINHKVIISKRKDGNGVNDAVTEQLIEINKTTPIGLIITADMGSSDIVNISKIKDNFNPDFIVTDHHTIPDDNIINLLKGFFNPERKDNKEHLPISGCFVAFLTIVATKLQQDKNTPKEYFNDLLPYVAITTLTDVISLKYKINRQVLHVGMHEINSLRNPLWRILKRVLKINTIYDDVTIGFIIGPLLNTGNRTNNEELVLDLLTTDNIERIPELITALVKLSNGRKKAQKILYKEALQQILQSDNYNSKANTPIIKTPYAINGIIAGKLSDFNNKPSICFVDDDSDVLQGSARGVAGDLNIVEIFKTIHSIDDSIIKKYGGHKQAAGCAVYKNKINEFRKLLDETISTYKETTSPTLSIDLEISPEEITPALIDELAILRPAGKDLDAPILKSKLKLKRVFDFKALFKFIFTVGNRELEGMYFKNNYATFDHNNVVGFFEEVNYVNVIYNLEYANYGSNISLQLRILDVQRI